MQTFNLVIEESYKARRRFNFMVEKILDRWILLLDRIKRNK